MHVSLYFAYRAYIMFQSALRQRFEDDKANKKAEDIFSFYKNFAFSPTFSSTNTNNKEPGANQNRYRQGADF